MHRSWHCLSPMWLTSPRVKRSIAWGASGIRFPKHPSIGVWASIFPPLSGILPRKRGPRTVEVAPSFSPALRLSGRRESLKRTMQALEGQRPKEIEQQGKSQHSRPTFALMFPQSTRTPLFQPAPGCNTGIGLELPWNLRMGLLGSDPCATPARALLGTLCPGRGATEVRAYCTRSLVPLVRARPFFLQRTSRDQIEKFWEPKTQSWEHGHRPRGAPYLLAQ